MKDINAYGSFEKIHPVNEGLSGDKKYRVETKDGKRFLLRICDASAYERKKKEYDRMSRIAATGVSMPFPIDFGYCDGGNSVYQLFSWCDGENLETMLPSMSEADQYAVGIKAGEILRRIHNVKTEDETNDWLYRYIQVLDERIQAFYDCGVRFDGWESIIDFYNSNRQLLKNRPKCYLHGDYHAGNLLLSGKGDLSVIDWELLDFDGFGDPWADFVSSNDVCAGYPHYMTGQIHGYFCGEPPEEFWGLFALYMSTGAITAIPWAFYRFPNELESRIKVCVDILHSYSNMQKPIPAWYLKDFHTQQANDNEQINIKPETLTYVLTKMLGKDVVHASYMANQLKGGTVGDVRLVTGTAVTADGEQIPYDVVLKTQKKWKRYGDPDSWRREYDLYASDLSAEFLCSLRWPVCYHSVINDEETQLWMEYIDGVSGLDLTVGMYERAAYELGRFQGMLYAKQPAALNNLTNLGKQEALKEYYLHYRSWNVVYDYVRSDNCEIPGHLCKMLIGVDDNAEKIFNRMDKLPVVLCHRDFWVTNIFYVDDKIVLIDWDTAGWGSMGEDLASLIADEADIDNMVEIYHRTVPAYYKGFSEYADVSHIKDDCVYEMILLMFGYRIVEWFINAESPEEKTLQLDTLQKIYEIGERIYEQ